jgi:hypothetical protein
MLGIEPEDAKFLVTAASCRLLADGVPVGTPHLDIPQWW